MYVCMKFRNIYEIMNLIYKAIMVMTVRAYILYIYAYNIYIYK